VREESSQPTKYDAFDAVRSSNRVLTETLPLSLRTVFQYDGVGNRPKRTNANGAVTTHAGACPEPRRRDRVSRPVTMTYPPGVITYAYNSANLRTTMTDTTGATLYAYDEVAPRGSSRRMRGTRAFTPATQAMQAKPPPTSVS